ncbi:MAG: hypothetical protein A2147_10335 [Chloroflexi bacterium RBG_16_57_8]|nr:MAG: hypothetical protein A2147_10335 [Chloroflexi bacterium RBG_16_57_8]
MAITIREYRESDHDACRSLWAQLAQHHADIYEDPAIAGDDPGRGLDEYLTRADRCGMWVAESDARVVGFAGLLDVVGEEGVAEVEPVVVESASRDEGIGTGLIEHASEVAKKKGFRFLQIRPELRNEQAFALYVRLGFSKVGAITLFQDIASDSKRKWRSGLTIFGRELNY